MKLPAIAIDDRTTVMTEPMLECRMDNHQWRRLSETPVSTTRSGVVTGLEVVRGCSRCETMRTDVYNTKSYELLSRKYKHGEGYLIKTNGAGKLHVEDYRAAFYTRT